LEKKATSGILVTLILFTGLIGMISVPVVTEVIPDLSIEGIVLPYWGFVLQFYPTPDPEFFYMINATVANLGTADAGSFSISFSVLLDETEVPEYYRKKTISGLAQGASETVWFDLRLEDYGIYTFFIEADCDNDIPEADETNNVKTTWVIGTITGDFCGDSSGSPPDGDVDWFDFCEFACSFGRTFEQPPYDPADINYDGAVDWFDFGTFAANYGNTV